MRLAYGANCGNSVGKPEGGRQWSSGKIHTEKAKPVELKDDTDVSLWPSQPSVTGHWPRHTIHRHTEELVGGLRRPVIMTWKMFFQHGQFPTTANSASV